MKNLALAIMLLFGASALSQEKSPLDFVLDHSKPYVYLKFDHIGPRKPHQDGEVSTGLWLRVVNNCRIPIVFRASGGLPGDIEEPVLEDEVVEEEPLLQIVASDPEIEGYRKDEELRQERLKQKPHGYSSEVSGVVTVQPGKELLFSFPVNHVDEYWYLRVKFALNLERSSVVTGPFTYLPFYKWDIPRDEKVSNPPPTQTKTK
jgi:hypothetical protein